MSRVTVFALLGTACVTAVVVVAANASTSEPLASTVAPQETVRRLETAGLGGIFRYRSYGATVAELQRLAKQRPDLAKLWSTQERYGLQSAGVCEGAPCMNWVLEVTDHATLGQNAERPDLLISGALHGDEQVGPVTTIELARWLIQRYDTDEWARRLVQTRRLLLVPMTNAWCASQPRPRPRPRPTPPSPPPPPRLHPMASEPRSLAAAPCQPVPKLPPHAAQGLRQPEARRAQPRPEPRLPVRAEAGGVHDHHHGAHGQRALPAPPAAARPHLPRGHAGDRSPS